MDDNIFSESKNLSAEIDFNNLTVFDKWILSKLKKETNNLSDIIYRKKQIGNNLVYIIKFHDT